MISNHDYKQEIDTISNYWSKNQNQEFINNIQPQLFGNALNSTNQIMKLFKTHNDKKINEQTQLTVNVNLKYENSLDTESVRDYYVSLSNLREQMIQRLLRSISYMSLYIGCDASNKNLETINMKSMERKITDIDSKHSKELLEYLKEETLFEIFKSFLTILPIENNKEVSEEIQYRRFVGSNDGKLISIIIELCIYGTYSIGIMAEKVYSGKVKANYK